MNVLLLLLQVFFKALEQFWLNALWTLPITYIALMRNQTWAAG